MLFMAMTGIYLETIWKWCTYKTILQLPYRTFLVHLLYHISTVMCFFLLYWYILNNSTMHFSDYLYKQNWWIQLNFIIPDNVYVYCFYITRSYMHKLIKFRYKKLKHWTFLEFPVECYSMVCVRSSIYCALFYIRHSYFTCLVDVWIKVLYVHVIRAINAPIAL
jgi:hypothetical protein